MIQSLGIFLDLRISRNSQCIRVKLSQVYVNFNCLPHFGFHELWHELSKRSLQKNVSSRKYIVLDNQKPK